MRRTGSGVAPTVAPSPVSLGREPNAAGKYRHGSCLPDLLLPHPAAVILSSRPQFGGYFSSGCDFVVVDESARNLQLPIWIHKRPQRAGRQFAWFLQFEIRGHFFVPVEQCIKRTVAERLARFQRIRSFRRKLWIAVRGQWSVARSYEESRAQCVRRAAAAGLGRDVSRRSGHQRQARADGCERRKLTRRRRGG